MKLEGLDLKRLSLGLLDLRIEGLDQLFHWASEAVWLLVNVEECGGFWGRYTINIIRSPPKIV